MAEALLKNLASDRFEAYSAGLNPGTLNPLAVSAMQEMNIDISHQQTKSVLQMQQLGNFDYVISVCDESVDQACPVWPGKARKLHWPFADPSKFQGEFAERLKKTIRVRDQIKMKITEWLKTNP